MTETISDRREERRTRVPSAGARSAPVTFANVRQTSDAQPRRYAHDYAAVGIRPRTLITPREPQAQNSLARRSLTDYWNTLATFFGNGLQTPNQGTDTGAFKNDAQSASKPIPETGFLAGAKSAVWDTWDGLKSTGSMLWDGAKTVKSGLQYAVNDPSGAWEATSSGLKAAGGAVADGAQYAWNNPWEATQTVGSGAWSLAQTMVEPYTERIQKGDYMGALGYGTIEFLPNLISGGASLLGKASKGLNVASDLSRGANRMDDLGAAQKLLPDLRPRQLALPDLRPQQLALPAPPERLLLPAPANFGPTGGAGAIGGLGGASVTGGIPGGFNGTSLFNPQNPLRANVSMAGPKVPLNQIGAGGYNALENMALGSGPAQWMPEYSDNFVTKSVDWLKNQGHSVQKHLTDPTNADAFLEKRILNDGRPMATAFTDQRAFLHTYLQMQDSDEFLRAIQAAQAQGSNLAEFGFPARDLLGPRYREVMAGRQVLFGPQGNIVGSNTLDLTDSIIKARWKMSDNLWRYNRVLFEPANTLPSKLKP